LPLLKFQPSYFLEHRVLEGSFCARCDQSI